MQISSQEDDVWIADRNFCTLNFLSGIVARKGYFIIREHQCFLWYDASEFRHIGSVEGGTVFEQTVKVSDDEGYLSNIHFSRTNYCSREILAE
ncbi:MAG: hypothetical protein V7K67_14995 [Nostoc sp.]|uniref:hypothetical protein n=1 Tax=Nostoc sp. TaxID=1180 RepID=UPI002FEF406E